MRAPDAIYLPLVFLTVALLGGLRIADRVVLMPPPLFALVLATLLLGALVRGGVFVPERLLSATRTPIENLNGLVSTLALFVASAQVFNLVVPESGLPLLFSNVFLFVLLINTLVGSRDRIAVLRSLAVTLGAAFIVKFVVLAALSTPGEGTLKRMLYVLLEGITLGTLTQIAWHPATGYVAFGTLVLFLIGIASLPSSRRHAALVKSGE